MTKYHTNNPLGSTDPRDLYDNAQNLDHLTNDQSKESHPDRLGVERKTWHGMESQFDAAEDYRENAFVASQADKQSRFNDFIASSGYQFLGDYAAGIEITEYNQIIRDSNGEFWRLSGQVELPYTTTGVGLPENDSLTPLGDAVLRQQLGDINQGAALLARSVLAVDSIADLLALPPGQRRSDLRYLVKGYYAGSNVGGGEFYWRPFTSKVEHNGLDVLDPLKVSELGAPGEFGDFFNPGEDGVGVFERITNKGLSSSYGYIGGNDFSEFYETAGKPNMVLDVEVSLAKPLLIDSSTLEFRKGIKISPMPGFSRGGENHLVVVRDSGQVVGDLFFDLLGTSLGGIVFNDNLNPVFTHLLVNSLFVRGAAGTLQDQSPILMWNCSGKIGAIEIVDSPLLSFCDGVRAINCTDLSIGLVKGQDVGYRLASFSGDCHNSYVDLIHKTGKGAGGLYAHNAHGLRVREIYVRGTDFDNGVKLSRGTSNFVITEVDIITEPGSTWGFAIQGGSNNKLLSGTVIKKFDPNIDSGSLSAVAIQDHPIVNMPAENNSLTCFFGVLGDYKNSLSVSGATVIKRVDSATVPVNNNTLSLIAADPENVDMLSSILVSNAGLQNGIGTTNINGSFAVNRRNDVVGLPHGIYTTSGGSGAPKPKTNVVNSQSFSTYGEAINSNIILNCIARSIYGSILISEGVCENNVYRGEGVVHGNNNYENDSILDLPE